MDKKEIEQFVKQIDEADAILVGAASGMSAAAGHRHYYERDEVFIREYSEYEKKYGFHCTFDGFYYRYKSERQRWAFIAHNNQVIINSPAGQPYYDLHTLLKDKTFFVLTTNQDTMFNQILPEEKIAAIQGDDRFVQCGRPCCDELWDAVELTKKMDAMIDENLEIPEDMVPRCPHCGAVMEPWVRGYNFLEGTRYKKEREKWQQFVVDHQNEKILFLELGVGRMTPMFIQEPFWNLTYNIPKAFYININPKDALLPKELKDKGMAIHEDIAEVLIEAVKMKNNNI